MLLAEVCTHYRIVIFRQAAHDFLLKIVSTGCGGVAVALLERGATLFNIFFQPIVKILVAATFRNLRLVIELDLIDQQAGKTLCLAVCVRVFRGHSGEWIRRCRRRGCCARRSSMGRNLDHFRRWFRRRRSDWREMLWSVGREGIGKGTDGLN